jgi:hypothetical protein
MALKTRGATPSKEQDKRVKTSLGQLKIGSAAVAAAIAHARRARNRTTREARGAATEERASSARYKRARAKEDRERERAMNRRIRVQIKDKERPRLHGRTPRKLFYRLAQQAMGTSLLTTGASNFGGTRSIHFAVTARGFASRTGRNWRTGEGERAALYITREDGSEGGEAGWWSNIADDRIELAAFHRASEALEKHDRKNANVYMSEIIGLPVSLTMKQRRRAVRRYCRYFDERGLAYTVAMHAPDPSGNGRNYHCHIIYSLRPTQRLAPYDWNFAAAKVADVNTPEGILDRRRLMVNAINVTLRAAGSTQRYTHLSNRARGLGAPLPKVGQKGPWVRRRVANVEARLDYLSRLRAASSRVRQGLAAISRGEALACTTLERLRAQRNGLVATVVEVGGRMRTLRTRTIERLRAPMAMPTDRTDRIDIVKIATVGRLQAEARRRTVAPSGRRIAAPEAAFVASRRRRIMLEVIRDRLTAPVPGHRHTAETVISRLNLAHRHLAASRSRMDDVAEAISSGVIVRIRESAASLDPALLRRLDRAGLRIERRRRLDELADQLAIAAVSDLADLRTNVIAKLKRLAMRPASIDTNMDRIKRLSQTSARIVHGPVSPPPPERASFGTTSGVAARETRQISHKEAFAMLREELPSRTPEKDIYASVKPGSALPVNEHHLGEIRNRRRILKAAAKAREAAVIARLRAEAFARLEVTAAMVTREEPERYSVDVSKLFADEKRPLKHPAFAADTQARLATMFAAQTNAVDRLFFGNPPPPAPLMPEGSDDDLDLLRRQQALTAAKAAGGK